MPTQTEVRVLNPATRRLLTLPRSSNCAAVPTLFRFHPFAQPTSFLTFGIAGIGHDPRSDTYKVARFFFTPPNLLATDTDHNYGVEVYTIGVDQQWRETTARPPYPAHVRRSPAFFKGSLFWTIDERKLGQGELTPGFLRFRLEDESFSITLPPPGCRGILYGTSCLAELCGELGVAHGGAKVRRD
jgi:F-box interacting protein